MRIEDEKGTRRVYFDSLADAMDNAETPLDPKRAPYPGWTPSSRREEEGRRDWYASRDWTENVSLAFGGWKEGAEKVAKKRAAIGNVVENGAREIRASRKKPGVLMMGRYNQGHPRPFMQIADVPGAPRRITLYANLSASAEVDASVLMTRGGAACALVDALTRAGIQVEVRTVMVLGSDYNRGKVSGRFITETLVKRAEATLNLPTIAYALAHPSAFRRLGFSHIERHTTDKQWSSMSSGYGYPAPFPVEPGPDVIVLPEAGSWQSPWSSEGKAGAWVLAVLKEQGIELH